MFDLYDSPQPSIAEFRGSIAKKNGNGMPCLVPGMLPAGDFDIISSF